MYQTILGSLMKQNLNFSSPAPVTIIAEAGVNHNGDFEKAVELIDVAAESGADMVKFQTFSAKNLASDDAQLANYQKKIIDYANQSKMLEDLELKVEWHQELIQYAQSKSIEFISTPFDISSVELLAKLGLGTFKIPSGEITNLPFLREIGKLGKDIILSTGMSKLGEIEDALEVLSQSGTKREKITLLHCTTEYPAPLNEVNLNVIKAMREAFGLRVGYSDHTPGIVVSIAAVALGATVIEKHFTLDRNLPGPDHKASLEPNELLELVKSIKKVEVALGSAIKKPTASEIKNIDVVRKSIVAKINISKGESFTSENIDTKRPGGGISPMRLDEVIGRQALRDFKKDEMIEM